MKQKIGNSYLLGADKKAIVEFSAEDREEKPVKLKNNLKEKDYAAWFKQGFMGAEGYSNNEPSTLLNLVANNNLLMPLLQTNIDFCLGDGIGLFTKKLNEKNELVYTRTFDDTIEGWMIENDYQDHLRTLATDLYILGNFASEQLWTRNKKVKSVSHIQPTEFRAGILEGGKIPHYFIGDWINKNNTVKGKETVEAYDNKALINTKSIIHGKKYFPGQPYYGIPIYWGTKTWVKLANQIPLFHLSGLTKGYNIRWHIQIPSSYFDQFPEAERENEEEELMEQLDKMLSGAENAAKAFTSKYSATNPEWKITPLSGDIYDDAYKDIFMHSNTALSSANNIDPTLAGYDISGKLSSGSEKRNAYIIHTKLKTPYYRQLLLKELNAIKNANGWGKDIEFKFLDTELQTLDVNPAGQQPVVQNSAQ